jgi:sigma-B regulation protein RsbU (phosphoserine phosphatase)
MILIGAVTVIANALHPELLPQTRRDGLLVGICASGVFFILENLRALGVVPIPFDVEWIGVLILYLTLGRVIAIRLFTNERRLASIDQELATARRIQATLLPRHAPRISGLSVAARYVPMHDVAGDIYDFVKLDDHRQGILVADVSGHGVAAALIASMVKGAFRAQIDNIERPERVLNGMNRILTGQLETKFVTASCTFIDMHKAVLRYAAAGHPPLLIQQRADARCQALQRTGPILGQFPDAAYTSVERPMTIGDRLLLYTDGITEATNATGEEFGEKSLHEFLTRQGDLPAEPFADALVTAVCEWTCPERDETLADDLTLVVVDVHDNPT